MDFAIKTMIDSINCILYLPDLTPNGFKRQRLAMWTIYAILSNQQPKILYAGLFSFALK